MRHEETSNEASISRLPEMQRHAADASRLDLGMSPVRPEDHDRRGAPRFARGSGLRVEHAVVQEFEDGSLSLQRNHRGPFLSNDRSSRRIVRPCEAGDGARRRLLRSLRRAPGRHAWPVHGRSPVEATRRIPLPPHGRGPCGCGLLPMKVLPEGPELKCRRCKRVSVLRWSLSPKKTKSAGASRLDKEGLP